MKNQNTFAQRAKLLISTASLAGTVAGWALFAQQSPVETTAVPQAQAASEAQIPQWLLEKPAIPTLQPLAEAAPGAGSAPAAPSLRTVTQSMVPTAAVPQNQVTTTVRRPRPAPITTTRSSR